jgi:hypothetical protein
MIKSCLECKILNKVDVILGPAKKISVELNHEPFDNQKILVRYLLENVFTQVRIGNGTAAAILNLRAGMGKTYVAGGIINELKLRTLYIVNKRPLMMQAVKDLRAMFYPDDDGEIICPVYAYGSEKKRDPLSNLENHSVTVIVVDSALRRDDDFFRQYSFIIYDEVHSYCTQLRKKIFNKCTHAALGMSATTEDRSDGFDVAAHKELAFDDIIRAESIPGFDYDNVHFDCHAKVLDYSGPAEHTQNLTHESTGNVFVHYMHNQYLRDPYRLKLAVDEIISLYDWRGPNGEFHCLYLFGEEIELLKIALNAINEELAKRNRDDIANNIEVPELGLEMFTGGLKDDKIADISKNGRILASTYSYASTGISILRMSCIVFLTPRKAQMKQCIARILRRGSDLNIPRIVVDIVDKKTCLARQLGSRMAAYNHYGFEIDRIKVKYTDIKL